jgi:O-antigen/teichoic acid export membrane protein
MAAPLTASRIAPSHHVQMVTRASFDVAVISLAGAALRYGTQVMLARWMNSAEYGIYAYAWAWNGQLVPLVLIGLNATVLRFVPDYIAGGDGERLGGILSGGARMIAAWGTLLGCAGAGLAAAVAAPRVAHAMELAMLCLPLSALVLFYSEALRALYLARWAFSSPLLRPLGILIGAFWVARVGHLDAVSCTACALAATAAAMATGCIVTWHSLPVGLRASRRVFDTRRWLRVGVPIGLTTYFSAVVGEIGIVWVGYLCGPREAGLYSAACKTASLTSLATVPANALATPIFALLSAQKKREEMQDVATRQAHILFWPSLLLGIGLMVAGPFVLGLFGREFRAAALALALLVGGEVAGNGAGTVASLLQMTGHQDGVGYVLGGSALMAAVLSPLFIRLWGINGAALVCSVSFLAWKYIMYCRVVNVLGINPSILHAVRKLRCSTAPEIDA